MDFSQSELQLFNETHNANPKNFSEFNALAHNAIAGISGLFGIARAEYYLSITQNSCNEIHFPQKVVVFDKNTETQNEPVLFEYPLLNFGKITFSIELLKDKSALSSEQRKMLEIDLRQLYYIISSLVNNISYNNLIITDYMTGISNSYGFVRFIINLIQTDKLKNYSALFFNIRNFKSVHRSLSYLEGNEIMKKYCGIVAGAVTKNEMVARFGGDNFMAVILDDNLDYFLDLLQNIVIFHEKEGQNQCFMFSATVGLAKLSEDYDVGAVMLNANVAYQSARENRLPMKIYDKKASVSIIERKIILSKFHKALSDREFYVVYQPKVGVKDRRLHGAEALVRWRHDGGDIMPGSFVPILEHDGCICTLDFFMLEEVCKLQKKLIEMNLEPMRISVNFSKRHLSNNKLVEEIAEVIDKHRISHDLIEIELTESEDSYNQGIMTEVVTELGSLGIRTSIDDFGTGYSSLGMLKSLKLHELKIDKSFIPSLPTDSDDKSVLMLSGIIGLAKSLGLTIVAEGVETDSQFELIKDMGCDIVQGFIFDKPLSESDFIDRIKRKDYVFE